MRACAAAQTVSPRISPVLTKNWGRNLGLPPILKMSFRRGKIPLRLVTKRNAYTRVFNLMAVQTGSKGIFDDNPVLDNLAHIPTYLLQPLRLIQTYDRANFRQDIVAGLLLEASKIYRPICARFCPWNCMVSPTYQSC